MRYVFFLLFCAIALAGNADAAPEKCGHPGKVGGEQAARCN